MKNMKNKGFTKVELIVVIAVAAVLVAALVATFVGLAKVNKTQEQTQQNLDQLTQQIENQKTPTIEELEAKIAEAIAGIKFPEGVKLEDVNKAINDAIAAIKLPEGVKIEDVNKAIADAIAGIKIPEGVKIEDVNKAIADAIAGIEIPDAGLTAEQIQQIIDDAIAGIEFPVVQPGLSAEEVEKIIADAIAGIKFPEAGLTAEQIEKMITDAVEKALEGIEPGVTDEDMKNAIIEALGQLENKYLTEEEIIAIIEKLLAIQESKTKVDDLKGFENALKDPTIAFITLTEDLVLDKVFNIDRDLTINLNGKKFVPAKGLEYPDALLLNVAKDCEVVVKGGTIVTPKVAIESDMDFFRVASGASLLLEDVTVAVTVIPEVFWNNTKDVWQMNTAEHHIFTVGKDASLTLNNCDITVIAPEFNNYPDYIRNMSIVGVYFVTNASNSEFVMNGGSFTIVTTASDATTKTDNLYFVKSERVIEQYAEATNTVVLAGDATVTIGEPNAIGVLNSTNYLYWFGIGYKSGKTYYSGVKTVTMSTEAVLNIDGFSYTLNTEEDMVWDVEGICQAFGTKKAQKASYNIEEIKYHFSCTDAVVGCTYEAELTLTELAELVTTVKINGVTYHRCPGCGKGGLELH